MYETPPDVEPAEDETGSSAMNDHQGRIGDDEIEGEIRDLGQKVSSGVSDDAEAAEKATGLSQKAVATWPVAVLLIVVTVVLTGMNLAGIGFFRASLPAPTQEEISDGLELDLLAAVGYVEDFATENGRLPSSAEEMGLAGDEFAYEPLADGYRIVAERDGQRREYDSRLALAGSGGGS
jgi:hypothetical protein